MYRLTTQFALGALVALAAAGTPCLADEAVAAQPAASADALRVVRDKATGKLRAPNPSELKEMLEAEKAQRKARGEPEPASAQPLAITHPANGMISAKLGPEFLVSLEAHRDADGNLVVRHADPADEHVTAPQAQLPTE